MAYVTQQDLVDRFGQTDLIRLTDRTNKPPTTINATTVDRAIGDASALIDSHLAKAYALPLTAVPDILVKVAADIAFYFLHGKAAGDDKDSPLVRDYNNALRWLENVSRGLVVLDAAGIAPDQAGGGAVKATTPGRRFTRDSLAGL